MTTTTETLVQAVEKKAKEDTAQVAQPKLLPPPPAVVAPAAVIAPANKALHGAAQPRKWNDHLEHERIELLRGVVYKMQKQMATIQQELNMVRDLLKAHQHTAGGQVALLLNEQPPSAPIGTDPSLD